MDNEKRKMLRDLNNLLDQEEASCSYNSHEPNKSLKESMGNKTGGQGKKYGENNAKLAKKKVSEEKYSDYWPILCQPERLFCCCKPCLISETKFSMGCFKCKKNCLACQNYEGMFKKYEEPSLKSYIRLNGVPTSIMDHRKGSEKMQNAINAIVSDAIGERIAAINKYVVWIDGYESHGRDKMDIVISLSDQKTAEQMRIFGETNGGITHYYEVDIPFEVKIFNMNEDENNGKEDVDNENPSMREQIEQIFDPLWDPEMLEFEELNEDINESMELENQDGMEEEDSSSGVESSNSEDDYKESSGDSDESGDTCDDESSGENDESDNSYEEESSGENDDSEDSSEDESSEKDEDDEVEVEEEDNLHENENKEKENELNASEEKWPMNTYNEEAENNENAPDVLMMRKKSDDIAVLENGAWIDIDTNSSGVDEPKAKKTGYGKKSDGIAVLENGAWNVIDTSSSGDDEPKAKKRYSS